MILIGGSPLVKLAETIIKESFGGKDSLFWYSARFATTILVFSYVLSGKILNAPDQWIIIRFFIIIFFSGWLAVFR